MWTLNVASGIRVFDAHNNEIRLTSKKAQAVLAYLVLGSDGKVERGKLCGMLWSERPEATARASLRQCVKRLSADLGSARAEIVEIDRSELRLVSRPKLDLENYCDRIVDGDSHVGVLNPEDFFFGLEDLDPNFSSWARVVRQVWSERIEAQFEHVYSDEAKDPLARLRAARAQFELDRSNEQASRIIIEDALSKDDLPSALKQYQRLWTALDEEWGEEPSAELQALIVDARLAEKPAPPRSPTLTAKRPVILVALFEQIGPFSKPEYLVQGFRRELINSLVRFREWVITDYLDQASQADYVISASFKDVKDGVHMSVALKEVKTQRYVVSEDVVVNSTQWSDQIVSILRKLSLSLNIHLTRDKVENSVHDPKNEEAYTLWLKALQVQATWDDNTFDEATHILADVLDRAPNYAPAISALAGLKNTRHLSTPGTFRTKGQSEEALVLAHKAVSIDPLDARNQNILGWACAMNAQYTKSEIHFEMALDLNSNNPRTLIPSAHGLSFLGKHERAVNLAAHATLVHPWMSGVHGGYLMCIHILAGDYEKAAFVGQADGAAIPDFRAWRAAMFAYLGKTDEARAEMQSFLIHVRRIWKGATDPTDAQIADWLYHAFPIQQQSDRDRLHAGFALAGLPSFTRKSLVG